MPNTSINFSMCNEFFIYHDAGANGRDKATGVLALFLWGLFSLLHRKRAETNMGRSVMEKLSQREELFQSSLTKVESDIFLLWMLSS